MRLAVTLVVVLIAGSWEQSSSPANGTNNTISSKIQNITEGITSKIKNMFGGKPEGKPNADDPGKTSPFDYDAWDFPVSEEEADELSLSPSQSHDLNGFSVNAGSEEDNDHLGIIHDHTDGLVRSHCCGKKIDAFTLSTPAGSRDILEYSYSNGDDGNGAEEAESHTSDVSNQGDRYDSDTGETDKDDDQTDTDTSDSDDEEDFLADTDISDSNDVEDILADTDTSDSDDKEDTLADTDTSGSDDEGDALVRKETSISADKENALVEKDSSDSEDKGDSLVETETNNSDAYIHESSTDKLDDKVGGSESSDSSGKALSNQETGHNEEVPKSSPTTTVKVDIKGTNAEDLTGAKPNDPINDSIRDEMIRLGRELREIHGETDREIKKPVDSKPKIK